jgi:hypothetical protein
MGGAFRFAHENFIFGSGAVLSASSFMATAPASYVLDQLLSKAWRSEGPWVVVAGFNDRIDLDEGGAELTATLTPGVYTTTTAYALEVKTQLDAAGALTYTVTYTANRYEISAGGAFTLRWLTGTNAVRTAGIDLGFNVTANDTGASNYTGDYLCYQGQHYLMLDIPNGRVADLAVVVGHNLEDEGGFERREVVLQGSVSTFPTISHSQVLIGTGSGIRIAELEAAPSTPWSACEQFRLVFRDISNPDGFSQCGVWFVGEITGPSIRPSINEARKRQELSQIVQAIDGAAHGDIRPKQDIWSLEWLDLVDADLAILEAIADAMPPPRCFFVLFHEDDIQDTQYGFFAGGMDITRSGPTYHNLTVVFVEALG